MTRLLIVFVLIAVGMLHGCTQSDAQTPAPTPDGGVERDTGESPQPDMGSGDPVVVSIVIEPQDTTIGLGERITYVATPFDADGNVIESGQGDPQWESSEPSVAPISSGGTVTGATVGTTQISVTYQEVTESVELTVSASTVTSVDVLPPRVVFTIGDDFDFLAVPRDGDGERIDEGLETTWSVRDTSVATVDGSTVTAVGAGTTELVATIAGVEGTAEIVVEDAVLESIEIDQTDANLAPGDALQLSVSFTWQGGAPSNDPTVTWSSSDPAVTVDAAGNVVAAAPGTATITAEVGDQTDSIAVDVAGRFDQIAVGASHTCGLIRSAVFCWGANEVGQLGHSEQGFARVTGVSAKAIAAGRAHTCARDLSDDVVCWGANDAGQHGVGNTNPGPGKVTVPFAQPALANGRLYADRDATCAGDYCWGDLVSQASVTPTFSGDAPYFGSAHRCDVEPASTTCSGANDQGQLGLNTTGPSGSGTPVGGYDFDAFALGADFSCGRLNMGGMACWGNGDQGQIGDGNFSDVQAPILTPLAGSPAGIRAGDGHVCAHTAAGAIYCWGANDAGQVGDGTTSDAGSPVDVSGGRVYVSVDAQGNRTCGLTSDGEVWCWGDGVATPARYVPQW